MAVMPRGEVKLPAAGAASINLELQALDLRLLQLMSQIDEKTQWPQLVGCALRTGLGLRDIAEALPCSVSTISRWQSGKAAPPLFMRAPLKQLLLKLAAAQISQQSSTQDALPVAE